MSDSPLKVLVFGAGAIGALYGAALSRAGADVSVVVRTDFKTISETGFQISSPLLGEFVFKPHQVYHSVSEVHAPPDILIIAAKTTDSYIELIRSAVGPSTAIVILQNGIGVEIDYQHAFPNQQIIGGLAFVCVNREGPGVIHHLDYGRLMLGQYPSGASSVVETLVTYFHEGGIPARQSESIQTERWKKLVWNAPFNPLSAIHKMTTDQLLAVPELRELCRSIMEEVVAVAHASGYTLPPDIIDRNIDDTQRMKPYKTSMLLDVESGRPIERVTIIENVISIASNHGVLVPNLITINAVLKGKYN